jgi:hypothetical protein
MQKVVGSSPIIRSLSNPLETAGFSKGQASPGAPPSSGSQVLVRNQRMTVHPAPGPIARALWLVVDTVRPPIVLEGKAKVCDSGHPFVISLYQEWPRGPLHIDVDGQLHNRGQQTTTVIDVLDARAAGQTLSPPGGYHGFGKDVTLEPGGERQKVSFCLNPPEGQQLAAKPGDTLTFKLRLTRGGLRAPRVKLTLQ